MTGRIILFLSSLLAAMSAVAQPATGGVSIHDSWVRLNAPGTQVTGAFMRLANQGGSDVRLVRADSPAAKVTELHNHVNEGGVMKMRRVPEIVIPAKGETLLKPGSYHVMLIDLKAPLREGEIVPLTLTFDDGNVRGIEVRVVKPSMEGMKH